jgi:23S rRNA pseudouridine955/2504/2580 synthase
MNDLRAKPQVPPKYSDRPQVRWLTVDEASEGQRLDNFLTHLLKGVPKSRIYRMVREGEVRVNKHRVSNEYRLCIDDIVRVPPVRVAQKQDQRPVPAISETQLPILFEDEGMLAVDKPAGLAVHGGSGVSFGVIERLRAARPQAKYLELVHRLDRETSGVLLIAKKRSALVHLHEQLRARTTVKRYFAIGAGEWPQRSQTLNQSLIKTVNAQGERHVLVARPNDVNALTCVTRVLGLQNVTHPLSPLALVQATLETGRTHQIRVHLAHNGIPIVGDERYGDFELNKLLEKTGLKRMFLHAFYMEYTALSGQRQIIESPMPLVFKQIIEQSALK